MGGKFRLEAPLAGGGMGSVWRGWDLRLDAPVAVKFMKEEIADAGPQRARFEREAKAAAQIRSPHVVHIYDHGIDAGTPYIVMEMLEGEDLAARLKRVRQLPVREVVRICNETCRGLHRAHRRQIVHRDLKPGNIFLSAPDDDLVKILDFGIAKAQSVHAVGSEATTTGQLLGSPHYMSPEQARGMALDGRSDLWSLSVILYRALTGHHPFRGVEIGDLIVRICTDEVPPPSTYRPGLSAALDAFFARAFQKAASDRYQTAKELAEAFRAVATEAEAVVDTAALSESSWDSTGRSHASDHGGSGPDGSTPQSSTVPLPPAGDGPLAASGSASPPPLSLSAPTPTGASGTLGSVLAEPRPKRRWSIVAIGAALAIIALGATFVALRDSPGAADGEPASAGTNEARSASPSSADGRPAVDDALPSATEGEDAGSAVATSPTTAPSVVTARPRSRPRPTPRAATPARPKPKPAATKTAAGYQPSDLGY